MPTPRKPNFLTASSSCSAANSGWCNATDAKPTNRSGYAAHQAASLSFLTLISWPAMSLEPIPPTALVRQHLDIESLLVENLQTLRPQHERSIEIVSDVAD